MCLEQFHRTIGRHLAGDDGGEVLLDIEGVDGRLGAVLVVTNFQSTFEELILVAVPVKTDADTHVSEQELSVPLLRLNLRRRQYAYTNIHNYRICIFVRSSSIRALPRR